MPLSLAEYLTAVPDLNFPQALHRVGTCPACQNYGMTLKLMEWKHPEEGPLWSYEPFCPAGCSEKVIIAACRRLLPTTIGGD